MPRYAWDPRAMGHASSRRAGATHLDRRGAAFVRRRFRPDVAAALVDIRPPHAHDRDAIGRPLEALDVRARARDSPCGVLLLRSGEETLDLGGRCDRLDATITDDQRGGFPHRCDRSLVATQERERVRIEELQHVVAVGSIRARIGIEVGLGHVARSFARSEGCGDPPATWWVERPCGRHRRRRVVSDSSLA